LRSLVRTFFLTWGGASATLYAACQIVWHWSVRPDPFAGRFLEPWKYKALDILTYPLFRSETRPFEAIWMHFAVSAAYWGLVVAAVLALLLMVRRKIRTCERPPVP
jgi:hypothetical protein